MRLEELFGGNEWFCTRNMLFVGETYRCPSQKIDELQESGQTPVCLLPTRKACCDINNEMLAQLTSEVHKLLCIDEVDETSGTLKWKKKAAEQLEKLNRDCNMTAGLEANLSLAVCARVMLHHNIDTQTGLVNGAIGTVLSITVNRVMVQFLYISEPYDVKMVRSRFIKLLCVQKTVSTNPSVYSVTIHKCQGGLSLDCAS